MTLAHPKPSKVRSSRIMDFAEGQECTLRIPMVCNFDPSTTVNCHLPGHGRGTSTKENDIHAAHGCSACHDVVDGRRKPPQGITPAIILDAMLRGLSETQARLVAAGLIVIPKG